MSLEYKFFMQGYLWVMCACVYINASNNNVHTIMKSSNDTLDISLVLFYPVMDVITQI